MKIITLMAVCCITFSAVPLVSQVAVLRSVEITYCIRDQLPGPTLDDFRRTNTALAHFLSLKMGVNLSCYIAPTTTGYVLVWIDGEDPVLTPELRLAVEDIIRRNLDGRRTESDDNVDKAKPKTGSEPTRQP